MSRIPRYFLILTLGVAAGVGLTFKQGVSAEQAQNANSLPFDELRVFSEVFGKIKSDYVEQVDDKTLLRNAIQGMLAGLDPHSNFLDADSFKDIRIGTEGKFGGLGIEVTLENGFVKVITPIDDTPAFHAGVQVGDIITKIDGEPVKGKSLDEAVRLMRGEPGSKIILSIAREGETDLLDIELERAEIKITSVKTELLQDDYGYIRITQFQASTAESLRKAITRLKERAGKPLNGLILDLRNNPGGVLNGAVAVSDVFITNGVIVSTRGRNADSELSFTATPNDYLDGAPLVVLVNSGSASASEIVAGALQDHKRAVIMGTNTFGKGSVQTILPMNNGAALKITTARYYTPENRSIQATGIKPDIIVENLNVNEVTVNGGNRLREADLAGHLENENEKVGEQAKIKSVKGIAERDYQVREALNLLKGMSLVRANLTS